MGRSVRRVIPVPEEPRTDEADGSGWDGRPGTLPLLRLLLRISWANVNKFCIVTCTASGGSPSLTFAIRRVVPPERQKLEDPARQLGRVQ